MSAPIARTSSIPICMSLSIRPSTVSGDVTAIYVSAEQRNEFVPMIAAIYARNSGLFTTTGKETTSGEP
jgi:hypothetical protein